VRATPLLLSAIQARKCVRESAQAYLAYVTAKPKVVAKLEDISVVCDFSNVFVKISRLPPDREVEFTIELMLETQPIHKALYRMVLTELRELKKQF
jgi:hypothetical protein